jgi:Zn finger protein HypA/HybF involved in hydrogenase expression
MDMERKEGTQQKPVKLLLCAKCGREYIYDSVSRTCPECKGVLKQETVVR